MSRRNFVAGNWKMNCRHRSAVELTKAVSSVVTSDHCEVALCPPSVYLSDVIAAVGTTGVTIGAQNMSAASDGAFTGEVNADMLVDVGCKVVILGHSERRQLFGETDSAVAAKTIAALKAGLTPIVCVGETLAERESDQTDAVVGSQVKQSLNGVDPSDADKLVIAYEPVWAIGTGRTASPEQAEAVHAMIRKLLSEIFSPEAAQKIRIQYGGSVKPGNAAELMSQPNIDGALVGGASLNADDFLQIIKAAS